MKTLLELNEQPYDQELLRNSRIYSKSRKLFISQKGTFSAKLLSAERSLNSATLIVNEIEYSPLATELEWSLTEPSQRKDLKQFKILTEMITNVFHEQNHRTLWSHFKKEKIYCPQSAKTAYYFLNLAESLVIALDMALGDELKPSDARSFHATRVIYSPGWDHMRKLKPGTRAYRNALQVAFHTTYFRLCNLPINTIVSTIREEFLNFNHRDVDVALQRALRMSPNFIEVTNPDWQKSHARKVMSAFKPPRGKKALALSTQLPFDFKTTYKIGEAWFKKFGL